MQGSRNRLLKMRMALAVAGASAFIVALPAAVRADDLDTISSRVIDGLLSSSPSKSTVQGYMSSLQSDGSWSDVDYASTAATNWSPLTHLQRMEAMAQLYANPSSSLYHNATLATDLSSAMNYWIATNSQSSNWFDNDIAGPQALGATMVLAQPAFSSTLISQGQTILARAKNAIPSYTGQNVVDLSIVGVYGAIVSKSATAMSSAFGSMNGTVFVSNFGTDGIQADHTYHIHGIQLYMGGYGTSYVNDMLNWASVSTGTSYALTDAQEHTIVDYLLDGTQWFIRGKTLDLAADGRQVTFQSYAGAGTSYVGALQNALQLGTYRTNELQSFLARQQATIASGSASSTQNTLSGNRAFYDSDAMVQQRPAYYASVKVASNRTSDPESGNDQGLKNLYLGDGVNQIMVTGNEYLNIQPSWNWRRLPGTTVEQDTRSLKPASDWGAVMGTTSYAGGVSDGTYGAEAFNYSRFDVSAKKSWFFFDKEEVALGAGITSSNTTYEVDTTINQCLLTSTVSYETTASSTIQTLTTGTVTPANLKWVYQGGVGYIFITPVSNATIQAIAQSGTWSSLNTAASTTTVTQNVFTLYINHGTAVSNGSYSYIAVPGTTAAAMDAYVAANPIQILRNDSTVQAIRQSSLDITQAAFYASGSFTLSAGQTVTASAASAVMLQRQQNVLKLSASSPEAKQMALQVQLAGVTLTGSLTSWFDALGTGTAGFNLPGGNIAGSTVGITLASNGAVNPTVALSSNDGITKSSYTVTAGVSLAGNTTFDADSLSTLAFNNLVSGAFSVTKIGAGTMALAGANTFTGGLNVNGGIVRATNATAFGSGITTVNTGGTFVLGATYSMPIKLAGGTLNFSGTPSVAGSITAAAGTTSTIQIVDPGAPSTAINVPFTGALMGSGSIVLANATGVISPDGGQAFRINASNSSNFSGSLVLLNNVKGELFGTTAGGTTPAGTGTIVMTAGDAALGASLNAVTTTGGYSELNLRINTGSQVYGNNLQITGNGLAILNPLGAAPAGATVTLGNLQIGAGQTIATYTAASFQSHPVIFQSVTLTGGTATFSPKLNGFGASTATGVDLYLGDIHELTPNAGITMGGVQNLYLTGNNNFSGPLTVNSGTVQFAPSTTSTSTIGEIAGTSSLYVNAGASVMSGAASIQSVTVGGSWQIRPNAGASLLHSLIIGGTTNAWSGSVDLGNNLLVLEDNTTHNASFAALQNQIVFGKSHSAGVSSSTLGLNQSLIVLDNAIAKLSSFDGIALDNGSILATAAFNGDATLDGKVDINDLAILATHWHQTVSSWTLADFDGTNYVDTNDLQMIANDWGDGVSGPMESFNQALSQFPNLPVIAPVPEPSTLAIFISGAVMLVRRRALTRA